jgi:hypothetical protein
MIKIQKIIIINQNLHIICNKSLKIDQINKLIDAMKIYRIKF